MNEAILRIYHWLPFPVRNAAASLHGVRLRSRRYGPETERLVEEALERESWTANQWKEFQEQRLSLVLHRAVTFVPYYRELWAERRRRGEKASWEYLENWPILEKESLRENPKAFVADDRDPRQMIHESTSGTTGKALELWRSIETERAWYALFEARSRRWYGISRSMRWGILGGQLVAPAGRTLPPFWIWNSALNQLYMSSYHLAPDLIGHYLDALGSYGVSYLYGYPSALYELAQEALRSGRQDLKLKVVLANAEPVFAYQREAVEKAFQCSLRETYGMSELVTAAGECCEGQLHLWPEVAFIEVANEMGGEGDSRAGDLLGTGLLNIDMPLIRYRVGDRVTLSGTGETCRCGRRLPLLSSVDGRLDDILFTADGRHIGRLDPVFKAQLPIREAQIVQEGLDRIKVRYVPTADFKPAAARLIVERLRARLGRVEVIMERVDTVPRTANGKFRAVVCNLSPELKASLMKGRAPGRKTTDVT